VNSDFCCLVGVWGGGFWGFIFEGGGLAVFGGVMLGGFFGGVFLDFGGWWGGCIFSFFIVGVLGGLCEISVLSWSSLMWGNRISIGGRCPCGGIFLGCVLVSFPVFYLGFFSVVFCFFGLGFLLLCPFLGWGVWVLQFLG